MTSAGAEDNFQLIISWTGLAVKYTIVLAKNLNKKYNACEFNGAKKFTGRPIKI